MKHINCLLILFLLILFFISLCRCYQSKIVNNKKENIRENLVIYKTYDPDTKARSGQFARKVVTPRTTPTKPT